MTEALTLFFLGNYSHAVAEAELSHDLVTLNRARIALGQASLVVSDLSKRNDDDLKALSFFAKYNLNHDASSALDSLSSIYSPLSIILQANICISEKQFEQSYTILSSCTTMECKFLTLFTLLSMHRPDAALPILEQMRTEQSNHILVFLARCWLAAVQEKGNELSDLIIDIVETFNVSSTKGLLDSPVLLQLQALSCLLQGHNTRAVEILHGAQLKYQNDLNIMWNIGTAAFHDGDLDRTCRERSRLSTISEETKQEMSRINTVIEEAL
ncbi:hypothetical protein GEMRC1_008837 [Eukaryota sp. GEM-RC1]